MFSVKNLFFLYLQRAKNFWHFVAKFISVVWKIESYVSRGTIWGRMSLLFWKKSCFSFHFRTSRLFSRLQAKQVWQCCQKCILRVHRMILRKKTFCRRINMFFYQFQTLGHFSAIFATFGWIVKAAFQVTNAFRGNFLRGFFVTLGHGAKRFGRFSKNFWQGCQT